MAKWRFGIIKTMWILVAKSHKNLLAKTHTFSSQSRKKKGKKEFVMCGNQTRTLHHTRSIKDLARVFCGKHYWQKLTEIYLQKLMHFIESGFDSPTCQFLFLFFFLNLLFWRKQLLQAFDFDCSSFASLEFPKFAWHHHQTLDP